jgi:pimeloyl-ACP methyl ester carboxylesterase
MICTYSMDWESEVIETIGGARFEYYFPDQFRLKVSIHKSILLSFGGYLSAAYALRHPSVLEHLVLVDPWGMAQQPTQVRYQRFLKHNIVTLFFKNSKLKYSVMTVPPLLFLPG